MVENVTNLELFEIKACHINAPELVRFGQTECPFCDITKHQLRTDWRNAGNHDFAQIAFNMIRSEEHTSELQSLMRISYAVFCLKQKNTKTINNQTTTVI